MKQESQKLVKCKVILLGDQSVGKTSVIKRLVNDKFDLDQIPTVGIDFVSKKLQIQGQKVRLQLWDTAGQQRFRSLIPSYVRDSDVSLIVFDVTCGMLTNLACQRLQLLIQQMVNALQQLKIQLLIFLKDRTKRWMNDRRRKHQKMQFRISDVFKEPFIKKILDRIQQNSPELMSQLQKWDYLIVNKQKETISYRPKYPMIDCYQALVRYLQNRENINKGIHLSADIELDTYFDIREDLKRKSEQGGVLKEIEIKGTDKKFVYFIGQRRLKLFNKTQFLSKCDKVVSNNRKILESESLTRTDKKRGLENKENEWVQGWKTLRENYFKQIQGKKK